MKQLSSWSASFFEQLESVTPDLEEAVDEMPRAIRADRRPKKLVQRGACRTRAR